MIGKMILPLVGGAPAAWNSCLFFFQALMLAGYTYAHFSLRRLGLSRQTMAHFAIMLVALFLLPISFDRSAAVPEDPTFWLIIRLFKSAGLPFFVLAALSPLLQTWFNRTGHARAENPYFLFAASNLGSFAALLLYPTLIETRFGLSFQTKIWAGGFVLLLILLVACRLCIKSPPADKVAADKTESTAEQSTHRLNDGQKSWPQWLAAALFPSALLLAITQFITVEVAPIPLLWVIPLAVYLITYVMAFSERNLAPKSIEVLFLIAILLFPPAYFKLYNAMSLAIPIHLFILFAVSLYCHSFLAAIRPVAADLTGYYAVMSLGSVIGSSFVTFAAPLMFSGNTEYPLLIIFSCFLARRFRLSNQPAGTAEADESLFLSIIMGIYAATVVIAIDTISFSRYLQQTAQTLGFDPGSGRLNELIYLLASAQRETALLFLVVAAILPVFIIGKMPRLNLALFMLVNIAGLAVNHTGMAPLQLYRSRNFFGSKKVALISESNNIALVHGSTMHGIQNLVLDRMFEPLTYFHRKGPLGSIFAQPAMQKPGFKAGIIGLGIGAMLAYSKPGQEFTYYEIDPEIIKIAQNPDHFAFLSAFKDRCRIVCGDGRRMLEQAPAQYYNAVIIDAFSSDSIPVHLLTREALAIYSEHLTADGSIIFHISNRYIDLKPALANLSMNSGFQALHALDREFDKAAPENFERNVSEYVVFTRSPEMAAGLKKDTAITWQDLTASGDSRDNVAGQAWTDDDSSLFPLLTIFR